MVGGSIEVHHGPTSWVHSGHHPMPSCTADCHSNHLPASTSSPLLFAQLHSLRVSHDPHRPTRTSSGAPVETHYFPTAWISGWSCTVARWGAQGLLIAPLRNLSTTRPMPLERAITLPALQLTFTIPGSRQDDRSSCTAAERLGSTVTAEQGLNVRLVVSRM